MAKQKKRNRFNYNKHFKNKKRHKKKKKDNDTIQAKFVEVTAEQCGGNTTKMIKRFMKKIRKEEILKPFYTKLAYHQTKGELERQKRSKGEWLEKKRQNKIKELENNEF